MSFDLISLVLQAGLIVKLVLLTLLAFSITSLGIIATKWRELRAADQDSEAFLEVYQRRGFSEAYDAARHLDRSPLAVVFLTTGLPRIAHARPCSVDWGVRSSGERRLRLAGSSVVCPSSRPPAAQHLLSACSGR